MTAPPLAAANWTAVCPVVSSCGIARLRPVIDAGGYLPGCDQGVPADVSWPNYVEYVRLLAGATGWL